MSGKLSQGICAPGPVILARLLAHSLGMLLLIAVDTTNATGESEPRNEDEALTEIIINCAPFRGPLQELSGSARVLT